MNCSLFVRLMLKSCLLSTLLMIFFYSTAIQAQSYRYVPQPILPIFNTVISHPNETLEQIIDSLNANIDPSDTGEGGIKDQLEEYAALWQYIKVKRCFFRKYKNLYRRYQ